jgi:hypothetical protein
VELAAGKRSNQPGRLKTATPAALTGCLPRVYDVASGKLLSTLIAGGRVNAAVFSTSGRQIAVGTDNGTALVSPLFETAQELVDHIIRSAPRCLTPLQRRSYHLPDQAPPWCASARKWPSPRIQ